MKTILRLAVSPALLWLTLATGKAAETYKIDPARSSITFSVYQYLGVTHGKFTALTGTTTVDRAHPERSAVQAVIEVKSIDTGIAKRDEHLRSPDFFDAVKYPLITFKSRSVKQTGSQTGEITGDLSMHGSTKTIVLHVKLDDPIQTGSGPTGMHWTVQPDAIKRSDFGLLFSGAAEAISGIGQDVSSKIEVQTESVR